MKKQGVHIFSVNYWPEPTGIGPYVTDFAEHLASLGHPVRVTTAVPHYPQWKVFEGYSTKKTSIEERNGVTIERVPVRVSGTTGLKARAIFELSYLIRVLPRTLRKHDDIVIGYSPGLMSGLAARICGSRGAGHTIVIQDLAGKGVEQSGMSRHKFVSRCVQGVETFAARSAIKAIVISPSFVGPLLAEGLSIDRITVLSNWAREIPAEIDHHRRDAFRRHLSKGRPNVVLHAGSIGTKQGLEQIVDAARFAGSSDTQYVVVGDGGGRAQLEEAAVGIDNLTIADPVDQRDLASLLSCADVLLISQSAKNFDMSFPSKIGTYLRARRPILAAVPLDGVVAKYVESKGIGRVVASGDAQAIASMAESLPRDREWAEGLGSRVDDCLRDWDRTILLEKWTSAVIPKIDTSA